MTKEIWKPVVGKEEAYEVSNLGRVRSLDRLVFVDRKKKGFKPFYRSKKGKLLKPQIMKRGGYLQVSLGKGYGVVSVHILVMESFVGPRPEGLDVCHNDGKETNCRLENLRYDTRGENNRDAWRQGKRKTSPEQVALFKREVKNYRFKTDAWKALAPHISLSRFVVLVNS